MRETLDSASRGSVEANSFCGRRLAARNYWVVDFARGAASSAPSTTGRPQHAMRAKHAMRRLLRVRREEPAKNVSSADGTLTREPEFPSGGEHGDLESLFVAGFIPYCGSAPVPGALHWNLDPILIAALADLGGRASELRPLAWLGEEGHGRLRIRLARSLRSRSSPRSAI